MAPRVQNRVKYCHGNRLLLHLERTGEPNWRAGPRRCGSGEMANTLALGASAARLAGSSPAFRTNHNINELITNSLKRFRANFGDCNDDCNDIALASLFALRSPQ